MSEFFEANREGSDIGKKALRSGSIALVARFVGAAIQLVTTMVLARLLMPNDYGLVAIITALTSFAPMLIDLGLTESTVQKPKITAAQVSSLFWISIGVACLMALILVAASPILASLYHQPALAGIASASGITLVIYSLSLQHGALLRRALRFKDIAAIEISGALCGAGVAIAMAVFEFGFWALVVRGITTALIITLGSWLRCNWKPGRPKLDTEVKSMLRFGLRMSFGTIATISSNSADRVIMGFMHSPATIGIYQNAFVLYGNALEAITQPLGKVGTSTLTKLRGDHAQFLMKYLTALSSVSFFSMPAFAILAVIAKDLVPLLLGDKWIQSGIILSIFALRGIVHVIETSQTWLHIPLGRPERWGKWAILTACVQVAAIAAGLPFDAIGVAISIVLVRSILAIPSVLYAGRPLDLRFRNLVQTVGRQFLGAIVVLVIGNLVLNYLPTEMSRISRIATVIGSCISTYLILVVGMLGLKDPLRLAYSIIK